MSFDTEIGETIERYLLAYPSERSAIAPLLEHVRAHDVLGITDRRTLPGHVTAGAVVVSIEAPRLVLVIEHRGLGLQLFPGGHCDLNEPPRSSAARELNEEVYLEIQDDPSGSQVPFDIDCHTIPANDVKREPEHWHYDFRFLFQVSRSAPISWNADEVRNASWVDIGSLAARHRKVAEKLQRLPGGMPHE